MMHKWKTIHLSSINLELTHHIGSLRVLRTKSIYSWALSFPGRPHRAAFSAPQVGNVLCALHRLSGTPRPTSQPLPLLRSGSNLEEERLDSAPLQSLSPCTGDWLPCRGPEGQTWWWRAWPREALTQGSQGAERGNWARDEMWSQGTPPNPLSLQLGPPLTAPSTPGNAVRS